MMMNCRGMLKSFNWRPLDEGSDGSTTGRWFEETAGRRRYVKTDVKHPELQTSAEVISSLVYKHFGHDVPEVEKIIESGKHFVSISDIGSDTKASGLNDIDTSSIRRLRIVAAYLADYDRIANRANNRQHLDGRITLIDFGGTLGAKARGDFKDGIVFSEAIGAYPANADIFEIMESVPLQRFSRDRETNRIIAKPIANNHPWRS